MCSSMIFNTSFDIFFFVSERNMIFIDVLVSIVLLSWTLVFSSFVSPESFECICRLLRDSSIIDRGAGKHQL